MQSMDLVSPSEHLCYVRCTYCNTVLAVGVPCKRLMDTVTVKCGHCNNLSFLSPRPPPMVQPLSPNDHHHPMGPFQGCTDCRRNQPLPPLASPTSSDASPRAPFVVKPPEKKHRLPSAYNRFMREEIQRIKAAKPDTPHREAFSMAAKNVGSIHPFTARLHAWAKCDPRCSSTVSTSNSASEPRIVVPGPQLQERATEQVVESFDIFKQMERSA
ncbi:protein DROOPING LEAF-like isoform X2 [Hordeum vulgare subsp. vulgare]|uniref:protein DROOPING LEAF-like isoform X2 n=1 Tax=Hordeum vulgare subsp. vulgare TaxID=112509 RepID=UPI001D1A36C3|nr:protein DROOPING LEAF-like isoform X2 [Hordeum vulgare subsp. vulgare]